MFWVLSFQWPLEFWTEFCFVEEKTQKICGKTCGQFRLEESVLSVANEFFFFPSPHCRFPACFPSSTWQTWPRDRQPHFHPWFREEWTFLPCDLYFGVLFCLGPALVFIFIFFSPSQLFLCVGWCAVTLKLSALSPGETHSVQKLVKRGGF